MEQAAGYAPDCADDDWAQTSMGGCNAPVAPPPPPRCCRVCSQGNAFRVHHFNAAFRRHGVACRVALHTLTVPVHEALVVKPTVVYMMCFAGRVRRPRWRGYHRDGIRRRCASPPIYTRRAEHTRNHSCAARPCSI